MLGLPEMLKPSVMEEVVEGAAGHYRPALTGRHSNPRRGPWAGLSASSKALINSVNSEAEVMDEIFRWWPDTAAQW